MLRREGMRNIPLRFGGVDNEERKRYNISGEIRENRGFSGKAKQVPPGANARRTERK